MLPFYVCIYAHMYTYTWMHPYTNIYTYIWRNIYKPLYMCIYIHIYVYTESMWVYVYLSIYLSIVSMYSDRNTILLDQRTGFLFIHRTTFATLIPHALILFRAVHWEQNVSWDCTRGERSWIYPTWRLYKLLVHLTTLPLGIEGV